MYKKYIPKYILIIMISIVEEVSLFICDYLLNYIQALHFYRNSKKFSLPIYFVARNRTQQKRHVNH